MPSPKRPDRLSSSPSVLLNAYLTFFRRRRGGGVELQVREADQLTSWPLAPFCAEVKNYFSYTAIPSCVHVVQRGNIVTPVILSDIDSGERGNQTGNVISFAPIRRGDGRTLL